MRFEFAAATRIIFGCGTLAEAAPLAASYGKKVLLVTGSSPQRSQPLISDLVNLQIQVFAYRVAGEPTIACIEQGIALARTEQCDVVIGMGGGSVIDAAKAISLLAVHDGGVLDYIEIVGRGNPFTRAALPCIAIPTTAGTGTEVTKNAVITAPLQHLKASLRSAFMLPRCAIIDPATTLSLPPSLTATTGIDALTQCIEALVSCKATPVTDALSREGIVRAARSLTRACSQGDDIPAREDMACASLLSGLALANGGLGAVHGFAAVLGGAFAIPHGTLCALLLPAVLETNMKALASRHPASPSIDKYRELARLLTGNPAAEPVDAVCRVRSMLAHLPIPAAATFAIPAAATFAIPAAALLSQTPFAARASSMKGNPVELTTPELEKILITTFL